MTTTVPRTPRTSVVQLVGFLACVEVASGVLQGYYVPIFTDIARHLSIHDADVNWFEAAQLMLSAIVVPLLARAGDVYGHKRILLLATALTAAGAWAVAFAPTFATFLAAWALEGFFVVWLPLEVSVIHRRTGGDERATRQGAGILVAVLEASVIVAALSSGALSGRLGMTALLALPAVVVTLVLAAIWLGVPDTAPESPGRLDWPGFGLLSAALLLLLAGVIVLRLHGPASPWPWALVAAGLAAFVPFARVELAAAEPLVDLRVLAAPGQWPIQVTAALFGASALGAQIPLSTFARTSPDAAGYGLGASASQTSLLIGAYVIALALGALAMPPLSRRIGSTGALAAGACCVALGYLLFLPFHATYAQTLANMAVVGLGSGALVAALPAAAAARAPASHTGLVTGMTNTTKTLGGSAASAVFALLLHSTGSPGAASGHAPLAGYLAVWAVCAATAATAAVVLAVLSGRRPA